MPTYKPNAAEILLAGLTEEHQSPAVTAESRRLLIIAGAGSGKTEVMSRRVGWWVAVDQIAKENIVAFTFTDAAAEELKYRIRSHIESVTVDGDDATLGGMYVGTIHGFCLKLLRDLAPERYFNYDILDDAGRNAMIQRGYHGLLGLNGFQAAIQLGQNDSIRQFLRAYDLLNEYDALDVELPAGEPPADVAQERQWIQQAVLRTHVGNSHSAQAFAVSAARFYAYLKTRRFLDFSTSQSELTRLLRSDAGLVARLRESWTHIVVDEVQDINPVQDSLIRQLVGSAGNLTAVGDHRQAIYAFRGGRVDLMERLHVELSQSDDGEVRELPSNFRSTPRIIGLANAWSRTIGALGTLPNPEMTWGNQDREDYSNEHIAVHRFDERIDEAQWIANTIGRLVIEENGVGARHNDGALTRGIGYSDIALLLRSSTDVRVYQDALRGAGIPSVVRAGPDLFSQPEVLLFLALLAAASGIELFFGNVNRPGTLPNRITRTLSCQPVPEEIIAAACHVLQGHGLPIADDAITRLTLLVRGLRHRFTEDGPQPHDLSTLKSQAAARWARQRAPLRRVFPQQLYHWMLEEAEVFRWDQAGGHGQSALFHLGQLSQLITSVETPGWTTASDLKYQIIALTMWGASNARTAEAPLLVNPDAVTITTVHSAKGLQFPAVFLADVNARRFPSNFARSVDDLPFDGEILNRIDPAQLADNVNYDGERRLMYVALTRAERYLFVSRSGRQVSRFMRDLERIASQRQIEVWNNEATMPHVLDRSPIAANHEQRLATSFSELRYYLECPHDFYLRKVLGFSPTIDQAFGYGRGVHNILREIHRNPRYWANLAADGEALSTQLRALVQSGLFYMRYTTGDPLLNMRETALRGLADYVATYADELASLEFEPEKEFETLLRDEGMLISGSIDLVRLDDPPRVTIVDFKSGERKPDGTGNLSEDMMRLQVGIYGLAARHELEYEPDRGLIRYIGERDGEDREVAVNLTAAEIETAREAVVSAGRLIKSRNFDGGPAANMPDRCATCDHRVMCGRRRR